MKAKIIEVTPNEMVRICGKKNFKFLKACWAHYLDAKGLNIFYVEDRGDEEFANITEALETAYFNIDKKILIYRSR